MIVTLLIVFLVLAIAHAYPAWQAKTTGEYSRLGVILVALVVFAILYLMGIR